MRCVGNRPSFLTGQQRGRGITLFNRDKRREVILESLPLTASARTQRVTGVALFLSTLIALVTFRLYALQGIEQRHWNQLALKQHDRSLEVQGARGTVLDRAGRTLAVSVEAASIGVHPRKIPNIDEAVRVLSPIVDLPPAEIRAAVSSDRKFTWLARGLSRDAAKQIKDSQLPGIAIVPEFRRHYPQGKIAAAVLGRVGRDGQGLSGIESSFDSELSAPSLTMNVRRDALGRLLTPTFAKAAPADSWTSSFFNSFAVLRSEVHRATAPSEAFALQLGTGRGYTNDPQQSELREEGGSISLSLDTVIQSIVEEEFEAARERTDAKKVFGLVMDADSGEILALAQSPSAFDPNSLDPLQPDNLRSYSLQDAFEPGSTFKPLVAAAAVEAGVVSTKEIFDCENGHLAVGGHVIRDVHPVGVVSFDDVLIRSSNVCMAKMGARLGKERLHSYLRRFGFGQTTGIELQGEGKGILRPAKGWAEIDVATHSFGQGVAVTAVQLVRGYAALANGGLLVQPTLIRNGRERKTTRILSEKVAQKVSDALVGVTEDDHGTGKLAAISGVHVHGKTGTAQKARTDGRGYDPGRITSSFVGYVNGNEIGVHRKLVMLVAVDEPNTKIRYGGVLAAPVFQSSMQRILTFLLGTEGALLQKAESLQTDVTS